MYIALVTEFNKIKLGCFHKNPTHAQHKLPNKNNHLFNGVKSKLVATVAVKINAVAPHFNHHSNVFMIEPFR